MKYLPLLWAGVFRKKTRTILTVASVVVAFLLFALLEAVKIGFESGADIADAKRLLTTARYSIFEPLPLAYLRRIEGIPGVDRVAYGDWFAATYQNQTNAFPVAAVDPSRYLDVVDELTIAPDGRKAFMATRTGAVAGRRLIERFGWRLGQKLPVSSEMHPRSDGSMIWEFDLVGILDTADPAFRGRDDIVLVHAAYFDEARQSGKGTTAMYIVRVEEAGQAKTVSAAIDALFANSPHETKTQPEKEFVVGFVKQLGDVGALVTRILIAVFFTIVILTGNTMAQSIRERIPELAILKTLGFSDATVAALVVGEALAVFLLGAGVGVTLGTALMPLVNSSIGGRSFPPLVVSGSTALAAFMLAVGLALAVGLPPALRVRRLRIVEALAGR